MGATMYSFIERFGNISDTHQFSFLCLYNEKEILANLYFSALCLSRQGGLKPAQEKCG